MSLQSQQQETPLFKELASKKQEFNPYVNNAGTVIGPLFFSILIHFILIYFSYFVYLAIAGPKFCIVAGDTRISQGFSIISRSISKIAKLGPKTLLATSGMYADFVALGKYLKTRLQTYEFTIGRSANTQSIAALLSNTLYGKRFFPYYTFNILAGLDDNGDGIVYGYDAIGSYEPKAYLCQGSAIELILPILDNQLQGFF